MSWFGTELIDKILVPVEGKEEELKEELETQWIENRSSTVKKLGELSLSSRSPEVYPGSSG